MANKLDATISKPTANDRFREDTSVRLLFFETIPARVKMKTNHGRYV